MGTAGLTAMFAIRALEAQGLSQNDGPVLVTGVSGGVGSVAATMLAQSGYEVAGVTGDRQDERLSDIVGCDKLLTEQMAEAIARPMESAKCSCIDPVGGEMLARILGQLAAVGAAAIGNAGGIAVPANIIPFLLRGEFVGH